MLARLMVGAASLAAALLFVVIGAISQGFGGIISRPTAPLPTTSGDAENGRFRPCHATQGTGS